MDAEKTELCALKRKVDNTAELVPESPIALGIDVVVELVGSREDHSELAQSGREDIIWQISAKNGETVSLPAQFYVRLVHQPEFFQSQRGRPAAIA
jgi:hypothetical protein